MEPLVIRRTRTDIESNKEYLEDLEIQGIKIPKVGDPIALYYELDGKLSELIFKNKLIEYNKGDFLVNNPDYVVEKNGWVKVHKQNIHYDIYCGDASCAKFAFSSR